MPRPLSIEICRRDSDIVVILNFYPPDWGTVTAWVLLVAGVLSLFYISPLFKMQHLDAPSSREMAVKEKKKGIIEGGQETARGYRND